MSLSHSLSASLPLCVCAYHNIHYDDIHICRRRRQPITFDYISCGADDREFPEADKSAQGHGWKSSAHQCESSAETATRATAAAAARASSGGVAGGGRGEALAEEFTLRAEMELLRQLRRQVSSTHSALLRARLKMRGYL